MYKFKNNTYVNVANNNNASSLWHIPICNRFSVYVNGS